MSNENTQNIGKLDFNEFHNVITATAAKPKVHWGPVIKDLIDTGTAKEHGFTKKSLEAAISDAARTGKHAQALTEVQAKVAAMHDQYFILKTQTKVRVASVEPDSLNGHAYNTVNQHTAQDFRLLEAHNTVGDIAIADAWLESEEKRIAKGFTLDVNHEYGEIVNGKFNEWQGFGVEPVKGNPTPFYQHLLKLCDDNAEYAAYLVNWLAYGVQNPLKPARTCVMLIGPQGAGKGLLGNLMRSLYGAHGRVIDKTKSLTGGFNERLRGACFAFVDEAVFAGDKRAADALKHMITDPTLTVEGKFKDEAEVNNHLQFLMSTNHDFAMQVEGSDRRNFVLRVPDSLKADKAWLDFFYHWSLKPENKAAVLYWLQHFPLGDFDPEKDRPVTGALQQQKLQSMTGSELYWREVFDQDRWQIGGIEALELPVEKFQNGWILKQDVFNHYSAWHRATRQRGNPEIVSIFWRTTRRIFGEWADDTDNIKNKKDTNRPGMMRAGDLKELARVFREVNAHGE